MLLIVWRGTFGPNHTCKYRTWIYHMVWYIVWKAFSPPPPGFPVFCLWLLNGNWNMEILSMSLLVCRYRMDLALRLSVSVSYRFDFSNIGIVSIRSFDYRYRVGLIFRLSISYFILFFDFRYRVETCFFLLSLSYTMYIKLDCRSTSVH